MRTAVFQKYTKKGYYRFEFDDGIVIDFDDVIPKVLAKFDLKNNKELKGKTFAVIFNEQQDRKDPDLVIYTIESLKLIEE